MSMVSRWKLDSEAIGQNVFIPSSTKDYAFNMGVKVLFEKVESNPVGKRLLGKIRLCSSEIHIFYGNEDKTMWIHNQESRDLNVVPPVFISLSMKDVECFSTKGESISLPKHVILFHELTHAYHNLSGKRANSQICDPIVWESDEEYKTVIGFPSKKKKMTPKITENAFRIAEGLPERFGSWGPSGNDERQRLSNARVRLLGKIYEQNKRSYPENTSPPPVALCSINDLGLDNRCIALASIQGVDTSFNPKDGVSNFFWVDPSNILSPILNNECYLNQTNMELEKIKMLATILFPKLQGLDFNVKSLVYLRLSQQELNILLSDIPLFKD